MSGRHNNGSSKYNSGGGRSASNDETNKFCAVCSSAGRPDFNTHYVRADKFDRNSAITCPYLLSIECRICGGNGHTASYCKFKTSSDDSSRPDSRPSRLPPISSSSQQQPRAPPRIVFETKPKTDKIDFKSESAFPPLRSSNIKLPPLTLSRVQSLHNDEPLMRRGPPEASPVHSPAQMPKKKRSNNQFAALASSSSDSEDSDYYSPVGVASSPDGVGRCRREKSGAPSWSSVVTASPVHLPRAVAPRQLAPLAPLAPPVFKARENAKLRDKKKLWGDSDSAEERI